MTKLHMAAETAKPQPTPAPAETAKPVTEESAPAKTATSAGPDPVPHK